jgi:hypothetical protein
MGGEFNLDKFKQNRSYNKPTTKNWKNCLCVFISLYTNYNNLHEKDVIENRINFPYTICNIGKLDMNVLELFYRCNPVNNKEKCKMFCDSVFSFKKSGSSTGILNKYDTAVFIIKYEYIEEMKITIPKKTNEEDTNGSIKETNQEDTNEKVIDKEVIDKKVTTEKMLLFCVYNPGNTIRLDGILCDYREVSHEAVSSSWTNSPGWTCTSKNEWEYNTTPDPNSVFKINNAIQKVEESIVTTTYYVNKKKKDIPLKYALIDRNTLRNSIEKALLTPESENNLLYGGEFAVSNSKNISDNWLERFAIKLYANGDLFVDTTL